MHIEMAALNTYLGSFDVAWRARCRRSATAFMCWASLPPRSDEPLSRFQPGSFSYGGRAYGVAFTAEGAPSSVSHRQRSGCRADFMQMDAPILSASGERCSRTIHTKQDFSRASMASWHSTLVECRSLPATIRLLRESPNGRCPGLIRLT